MMMRQILLCITLLCLGTVSMAQDYWTEIQKKVAADRTNNDQFGAAVAIDGNYAVVSANQESKDATGGNVQLQAGAVYIFERQTGGTWTEVQKLVASDRNAFDFFGYSVAIEGDLIVVGAILEDEDPTGGNTLSDAGSAYIFQKNTAGVWVEQQKIVATNRGPQDEFGTSVEIDGTKIFCGAPKASSNDGIVYAYEFDGTTGQWVVSQSISISASNTKFGWAIVVDGNLMAIGAPERGTNEGLVQTYTFNPTTLQWEFATNLTAFDSMVNDYFGITLSLDGSQLAIGSFTNLDAQGANPIGANAGGVYFFELTTSGFVASSQKKVASDRQAGDLFIAPAISGTDALIGAFGQDFDENGANQVNSAGAGYFLELLPNTPPTITCPGNISVNNDPGSCGAIVNLPVVTGTDAEEGTLTAVQTSGPSSGSLFPIGTSTVEFTVTDGGGLSASCQFTVTVQDNEAPNVICQNITVALDATGSVVITPTQVNNGTTDNCGVAAYALDMTTFNCSHVGANTVTLTAQDVNGNTASCTAVVTVEDTLPPSVSCQDVTIQLDNTGVASISINDIDNGSSDNCGVSLSLSQTTFGCSDLGVNAVTLTATDPSGNTSSCTANVTVEDVLAPTLNCQSITVQLDSNGEASITPAQIDNGSTDNCGITSLSLDISLFDCEDVGTPVSVTLTAEDASGNSNSCTALVTVEDAEAPVLSCPGNQTETYLEGTSFSVPDYVAEGLVTAADNCTDPVTIFTQTPAPGTPLTEGVYTVNMTAADASGNTISCDFQLTVEEILGIAETSLQAIQLYPNPTKGELTLQTKGITVDKILLWDSTGRKVWERTTKPSEETIVLNLEGLAHGLYLLEVVSNRESTVKQILKY